MGIFSIIKRFILIFIGLCFFLPGIAPTVLIVIPGVQDSIKMDDWLETEATLESVNLITHDRAGMTTYQAEADYHYFVSAVKYTNNRVGITNGADNFDDFQKNLWKSLDTAHQYQQTVSVYYNPDAPTESVLNRQLPWLMFKIIMLISLILGGGGLLLIYSGFKPSPKNQIKSTNLIKQLIAAAKKLNTHSH